MIIGALDLSLEHTAAVVGPDDLFDHEEPSRLVQFLNIGEAIEKDMPESMRVQRLMIIAASVGEFSRVYKVEKWFVEGYAYGRPWKMAALGELGGAVKVQLGVQGLYAQPIAPLSARSTMLGTLPRLTKEEKKDKSKLPKNIVFEEMKKLFPQITRNDESDALAVFNHGLKLMKKTFLTELRYERTKRNNSRRSNRKSNEQTVV